MRACAPVPLLGHRSTLRPSRHTRTPRDIDPYTHVKWTRSHVCQCTRAWQAHRHTMRRVWQWTCTHPNVRCQRQPDQRQRAEAPRANPVRRSRRSCGRCARAGAPTRTGVSSRFRNMLCQPFVQNGGCTPQDAASRLSQRSPLVLVMHAYVRTCVRVNVCTCVCACRYSTDVMSSTLPLAHHTVAKKDDYR